MIYRKKLIEVALPLDAINKASAREKSIRHGHPSTLHLWWARRPLAAARAVIFSQMVDDPSTYVDVLRSDPRLRRKAESVLKARKKAWDETKSLAGLASRDKIYAPAAGPEPTLDEILAEQERERLFKIIEDFVLWENTTNEEVLQKAREEIWQSWRRACADNADHPRARELFNRHKLLAFHDPFAGGGTLPLEAQRLGLEAYASDLNPVAVLINKAMIEIPPLFAGHPPVNPETRQDKTLFERTWQGAQGLAEDIRYYGKWMRNEAEKRIGHLYPKVEITKEMVNDPENPRPDLKPLIGKRLTVIAWIWARTVKSPNPAFSHVDVPLASTFMLSTRAGKEAYVEPVIEDDSYCFTVKMGKPQDIESVKRGTTAGKRKAFRCLISDVPVTYDHIRNEGKAGRLGIRLMAIVAEGKGERIYLSPTHDMEFIATKEIPTWKPDNTLPVNPRDFKTPIYGFTTFADLFTDRQIVALTTFSDLVHEARKQVKHDALAAGMPADGKTLTTGGTGAFAYSDAVAVYLAFVVDKCSDYWSAICSWHSSKELIRNTFGRQAIPMVWDFAETNPFSNSSGNWLSMLDWVWDSHKSIPIQASGNAFLADAQTQAISVGKLISTDPPYYDNIGYADLSDFFYVWLRRSLRSIYPELFATLAVPKAEELVATPYRHGSKDRAESFFLNGMTRVMQRLVVQAHPCFPVTIYYAFKQSETKGSEGTASTGWDTFLDAVIRAGFAISGTWPMRTELSNRMIGSGTNALASSIIIVCRPRKANATAITRREFLNVLKAELPVALTHLQRGNIAPVDLAQAAIGPGMAVYTRYARVLDAEGKVLMVREALALINQILDEVLAEQEGDFDADTRWALSWFEQYGFTEGGYGIAETLSKAKNTSVQGMVEAGIALSRGGMVRLLKPDELPQDWDPASDSRLTVWEMVHHLLRTLAHSELSSAELLAKLGSQADAARELAYRLYNICERKKRAPEALAYNGLVQSWPEIARLAQELKDTALQQGTLFDEV